MCLAGDSVCLGQCDVMTTDWLLAVRKAGGCARLDRAVAHHQWWWRVRALESHGQPKKRV